MDEDEKQYIGEKELDQIVEMFSAIRKQNQSMVLINQPYQGEMSRERVSENKNPDEEVLYGDRDIDDLTWKEMMRAVGITT